MVTTPPSAPPRSGSQPPISPRRPALPRGEGAILVTGACGRLGKRVVRMQHRERRVIGVDRRPFPDKPKDVLHEQVDIRRKKLKDLFRTEPIEAVVHLGVMHDPRASQAEHHSWNVAGFQRLLEYVVQFQVPKLVVLSSANVYGPQPDNAQFLNEEAPLLGGARFSEIRDLIEVDMVAQGFFWKYPATETVILRPVHIIGGVHNAASNFLRLPTIPTLMGFDPMVQVCERGGCGPRDRPCARAGPPRDLQRRRARSATALAHRQDSWETERAHSLHVRQGTSEAALVSSNDNLPGPRARSHSLRVHGG